MGAVEADQTHNCHRPSRTGKSTSIFSVLFFVLLFFFMRGAWPLSEQNGFWSFNISVFVRIECGAWPLSDQNGSWSFNILVFVRIECGAWPLSDQNGSWSSQPFSICQDGVCNSAFS